MQTIESKAAFLCAELWRMRTARNDAKARFSRKREEFGPCEIARSTDGFFDSNEQILPCYQDDHLDRSEWCATCLETHRAWEEYKKYSYKSQLLLKRIMNIGHKYIKINAYEGK